MSTILTYLKQLNFDSRSLHVLHKTNGDIVKIISSREAKLASVIRELEKSQSLAPYYDFTKFETDKPLNHLQQKATFENYPFFFHIYTNLPLSTLIVQPAENEICLGRIVFHEYGIDSVTPNFGGVLLVDRRNKTLTGFDDVFLNRLGLEKQKALKTLGQPLENLLSPSPQRFMEMNLSPFDLKKTSTWNTLWSMPSEIPIFSHADIFTKVNDEILCNNINLEQAFLALPCKLDTLNTDFYIEAKFRSKAGWPYFTLGTQYMGEDLLPDEHGYLVGFYSEGGRSQIKKVGYTTHNEHISLPPCEGEHTLILACLGASFYLLLDNKQVLCFLDKDIRYFTSGIVSLGFRKGVSLSLLSLQLKTCVPSKKRRSDEAIKHIITLKSRKNLRFFMENLYRPLFQNDNMDSYMLYDITDLQRAIERLDKDVKIKSEEEQKLKSIVDWYRHGEKCFIGNSSAMTAIRTTALATAQTSVTVYLEGETGTGKEVMAHYVHDNSPRKNMPFIKIDCSTIPAALMESHLFGHEKGAFTGANARSIGLFERANGGTLFLDEAANLTLTTQMKLLQFFNDFTITRVGSTSPIRLDVRCIVASNKSLEAKVRDGTFREDLFYRISVVRIRIPLLKDRLGEINELSQHFLKIFSALHNKEIEGFSPEAQKKLETYSWPGNVRELKNIVENAVIFCDNSLISPEYIHFTESYQEHKPAIRKRRRQPFKLKKTDLSFIRELLNRHFGSVEKAAREIGVSKGSLYAFIKEKGIVPTDFQRGFEG